MGRWRWRWFPTIQTDGILSLGVIWRQRRRGSQNNGAYGPIRAILLWLIRSGHGRIYYLHPWPIYDHHRHKWLWSTPLPMARLPMTLRLPSPLLQAKRPPILPLVTSPSRAARSVIFLPPALPFIPLPLRQVQRARPRSMWPLTHLPTATGSIMQAATQFNWTYDNVAPLISSVSLAATNATIAVTMNEAVFNTNGGSGNLEASDFSLSLSGGNATLASATPSSISISGNVYTLGINLSSNMVYGNETITVTPVANSIYDLAGNAASTSQSNNTATLNGIAQQLGSDIDGEAASDFFGRSVSMNSSGDRVAIGAYLNDGTGSNAGHVRIYEYSSGSWSQLGADIDGEANSDRSGISVSMNSSGDRVAIGAYQNDGSASNAGHVRIYEYSSGSWSQLGADIDGEAANDYFGMSVSMNSSGDRVAIGANGNDGTAADAGHVRIYQYASGSWSQLGSDIDGEAASDQSGVSVSMNAAGDRVAIGAYGNDGTATDAGHVRIYQYASGSWSQLGADIDGEAAS